MGDTVRITTAVAKVLVAIVAAPDEDHYGLELMATTGLPSGTLYPILVRLHRAGWLDAAWEDVDPVAAGRPARRYYRTTPDGLAAARHELAVLRQTLGPAPRPAGKPRTV